MKRILLLILVIISTYAFSQQEDVRTPQVSRAAFFRLSPPLNEMIRNERYIPKEEENRNEIEFEPQFNGFPGPDPLSNYQKNWTMRRRQTQTRAPLNSLVNFEGVNNLDHVAPPDTSGDVSPTHYMQCVNGHTAIYDRDGNVVVNPFETSTFWQGTPYDDRNDGDAVILWDEDAQRWLVTQFYLPDNGDQYLLIAVSKTDDPTGQYYQYAFAYQYMPDYPKWSVWPNAYYMGANAFDQTNNYRYKGAYVSAFERDKILIGDANARFVTFGADQNLWSIFPADADVFPAQGTDCPFITDEVAATAGNNEVYIYNFHVDWNNTNNSTFQHEVTLNVADYGLFNGDTQAPQQGVNQKLDLLQSRIMFRAYYRHFNDHESLCMARTVNDNNVAAVRWYEFRDTGNGWGVYQQGTYNPGDGLWRWMASIAMNGNGDIAIGYSVSGNNMHPSIRATGRFAGDQLGIMTADESELVAGAGSQNGMSRWGDYSMMSIDPVDNRTFWYTTEYVDNNGSWRTKIIHFELPNQCNYPVHQATNLQANAQSETQIDLTWTRGDGDRVIVLARKDNDVNTNPADGSNYNANAQFASGDRIGNDNYVVYDGTGTSVSVTGLTASSTYYFAIYEYNDTDHCYLTPPTTASGQTHGLADVETLSMLQIDVNSAQGQGKVNDENGYSVTERGLCWSTNPNPTTADTHVSNGTGTGTFTVDLTNLNSSTTYYVRAYAINSAGTAYGDNVEFKTLCGVVTNFPFTEDFEAGSLPDCWRNEHVTNTQDWDYDNGGHSGNPANAHSGNYNALFYHQSTTANVTKLVTPALDFTGVSSANLKFWHVQKEWSPDQDELRIYYKNSATANWTLLAEYTDEVADWTERNINLPNLSSEYYVAFEATGKYGYGVGLDDVEISVQINNLLPTVTTGNISNITYDSAVADGNVTDEGSSAVTERGICWSTSQNPTTADAHATNGNGTGNYSVNLSGLNDNTTYYVRAYAINASGTAYGSEVSFTTHALSVPTVSTGSVSAITTDSATTSGEVTDDGGSSVTERGICWSTSQNPDTSGNHASNGTGTGSYTVDLTGLNANTTYYVRAYAINSTGTAYGSEVSFTTNSSSPPTVVTGSVTSVTTNSATASGNVTVEGSSAVTERGICWSTSQNPDTSGNHASNGTGTGSYTVDLTGLTPATTYYVRAYAINSEGTAYGSNESFTTDPDSNGGYCAASGNTTESTAINSVKIINKRNTNLISIDHADNGKTAGYSDYTNVGGILKFWNHYKLTVKVNTGGNRTVKAKAWIDWNQDQDFNDVDEEIDLGEATDVTDGVTSIEAVFKVKNFALLGRTRIRIAVKFNDYPTACETGFDGEVEDYTLVITRKCNKTAFWDGQAWVDENANAVTNLGPRFIFVDENFVTNGTNITACGMQVAPNKEMKVSTGDFLKIKKDIVNLGKIYVEDGASLVQTKRNAIIKGNGIYQIDRTSQNMDEQTDYAFWSSPIQDFKLGGILSNAWRYYSFDPAIQNWHTETANSAMVIAKGYAVSAPVNHTGGRVNVSFVNGNSPFNTGDITIPLTINGTGAQDDDDWNFIGNPYPSAIDFDALVNDNPNIEGGYYLWTNCAGLNSSGQHQTQGYIVYTVGGGATSACNGTGPSNGQYIPVAQGFAVEANASGDLTFRNTQRVSDNTPFVNRPVVKNRVWLDFTSNTGFNQTLVGFFDDATNQKDRLYDAHILDASTFVLYSLIGDEKFAVQGLAQWDDSERILPLGYTTNVSGTHQIAINRYEGIFDGNVNIYIRDLFDNTLHDLKVSPYVFTSVAGSFDDRFQLLFDPVPADVDEHWVAEKLNLLSNEGVFTVQSDKENIQQVEVYTITGKLILNRQTKEPLKTITVDLKTLSPQVVLFKILLNNGRITVMKAIR